MNPFTSKTAGASVMPGDWQTQQSEIEYQRKLAEQLAGDTQMPSGQMVGGVFVPPAWTQMLAKALNPMLANQHRKLADRKATELAGAQRQERGNTIDAYSKALQGTPEDMAGQYYPAGNNPDEQGGMGYQPAVAGSRDAAIAELTKSRDPMMQQLGMAQALKGMEPSKYGNTPHYDQGGRAYVLDDRGNVKYLEGVKARDKMENVNGVWQNPYDQTPNGIAPQDPNKPFVQSPSGPVPNVPYQTYKKETAKAGAPTVNVDNKAESKYAQTISQGAAERDSTLVDTAQAAVENLTKLDSVLNHLKTSDAITGMGSDLLKNIERARVLFTNSKAAGKNVSDTEMLDSMLGSDVFPMIKALGIGARGMDTPAEREFLRSVMTGTTAMNKDTLIRMTEVRRAISQRALDRYNDRVKDGSLDRYFDYSGMPKKALQYAPKAPSGSSAGFDAEKEARYQAWKKANGQ